ncbi:MAG TPA: cupin domain-containing protein [Gaiellaceae bacterium]
MESVGASVNGTERTFWWQGALMTMKASADETAGSIGLVEARFPAHFGPPLHVHHREDEAFYVLEEEIRFRRGDDEFVAGPGELVFTPREVPHTFRTGERGARALVLVTPGGFEEMFVEGGVPGSASEGPPQEEYDNGLLEQLSKKYAFDVVGPPLD